MAAARELAAGVKERATAAAESVAERVEQLRGQYERWRGSRDQRDEKAEQKLNTQPGIPAQERRRAGPEPAVTPEIGAPEIGARIERGLLSFREQYEMHRKEREAAAPGPKQEQARNPERSLERSAEKSPEQVQKQAKESKVEREKEHGHGFGLGR